MLCLSSLSLVLLLNPVQLPLRLRILRFTGFRQALSTPSRPHCDEELQSASKLMLTVLNLRPRLVVFVFVPDQMYCQQRWRA